MYLSLLFCSYFVVFLCFVVLCIFIFVCTSVGKSSCSDDDDGGGGGGGDDDDKLTSYCTTRTQRQVYIFKNKITCKITFEAHIKNT